MISSSGYQRVNGLRLWVHRFREESAPPSGLTILLLARLHGRGRHLGSGGPRPGPRRARRGGPRSARLRPERLRRRRRLLPLPRLRGRRRRAGRRARARGAWPSSATRWAAPSPPSTPAPTPSASSASPSSKAWARVATEPRLAVDRMQAWLRTLREVAARSPSPLTSLQEAVERLSLHHPRVPREVIETRARLLTRADETGRLVWAYDPLHRTTAPTPFHARRLQGVPPPHRLPHAGRRRRPHRLAPPRRSGAHRLPPPRHPLRAPQRRPHDALDRARRPGRAPLLLLQRAPGARSAAPRTPPSAPSCPCPRTRRDWCRA